MKERKSYVLILLRTLAAFLAIWLLMALLLTINNERNLLDVIEQSGADRRIAVARDVQEVWNGAAAPERKPAILQRRLIEYYEDAHLDLYRVYDDAGKEVARTPIAWGSLMLDAQEGVYDLYVLFDEVLTDEEQLDLAAQLRGDRYRASHFYGTFYGAWAAVQLEAVGMPGQHGGLYGEITGILREEAGTILPQKLVYYFEDLSQPVTVMESGHAMFEGAQLTTLRFDAASITSALAWGELKPEELLELYRQAECALDHIGDGWGTERCENAAAVYTNRLGVPIAHAYAYTPWRVATHGLSFSYEITFLAALLAAVLVAGMQIRAIKKERRLTRAVAHELKTPAAVLRAYAEALGEDVAPESRQEYLHTIVEEADRMAALVNELLDLSHLEGAKEALKREPVDLKALVEGCFERLRLPMQERGLDLELQLKPITVTGDARRLEQAVGNLALNVLRHADPGPVRAALTIEGGRTAVLAVENRCPAIPPEQLKRLWEPFYKGDLSRSGEGSGLGLAVVRNIVARHGGSCRAESTRGGIRFYVELPV